MDFEPGIVKTFNFDTEQLLVIESRRGDFVCAIHRGVCLIGCGSPGGHNGSGGAGPRPWHAWILERLPRLRIPLDRTGWKSREAVRWASA